MVHIKYCFNDGLLNGNMGCLLPICEREYFYELIITTKAVSYTHLEEASQSAAPETEAPKAE